MYVYWVFISLTIAFLIVFIAFRTVDENDVRHGNGLSYNDIENINTTVANEVYVCSICLDNIEVGTVVKVLPGCFHKFHPRCIDPWLLRNSFCPYCRSRIIRN